MTKLGKVVKAYFKAIQEARPKNIWFNMSKQLENETWTNQAIGLDSIPDYDEDYVNMFVRDEENADEEFENITEELHDLGYELAEGSAFECKNDVTRYLVVKKTS